MRIVMVWLCALGLAFASASSCSIDHRSNDFQCTQQADCSPGRECLDGYCVVPGGVIMDAPRPPTDTATQPDGPPPQPDAPQNLCPPQCSSCNAGSMECTIDCQETNCINTTLVCPAGWNCKIDCNVNNSCRNGINCGNAASCEITCSGSGSCRQIVSGPGPMDIECTGASSCRNVNCDASCACDIDCGDGSECSQLTCSSFTCGTIPRGCTSARAGCETCP